MLNMRAYIFIFMITMMWQFLKVSTSPAAVPFEVSLNQKNTGVDGNELTNAATTGDNVVGSPKPANYDGPPPIDEVQTTASVSDMNSSEMRLPNINLPLNTVEPQSTVALPSQLPGSTNLEEPDSSIGESGNIIQFPDPNQNGFVNEGFYNDPIRLFILERLKRQEEFMKQSGMFPFSGMGEMLMGFPQVPSMFPTFPSFHDDNMKLVKTQDINDGNYKGTTKTYKYVSDDPNSTGEMQRTELVDENGNRKVLITSLNKSASSPSSYSAANNMQMPSIDRTPLISSWINKRLNSLPNQMQITIPRFNLPTFVNN